MATPVLSNYVTNSDTSSPYSLSYTVASGIDQILLFVFYYDGSANIPLTGATFNGVAATLLDSKTFAVFGSASLIRLAVYGLASPTAGTASWVFTPSASIARCQMLAFSVVGCDSDVFGPNIQTDTWNSNRGAGVQNGPTLTYDPGVTESQVVGVCFSYFTQIEATQTTGTQRFWSIQAPCGVIKTLGQRDGSFTYDWQQTYGNTPAENVASYTYAIIPPQAAPSSGPAISPKYYLRRRLT